MSCRDREEQTSNMPQLAFFPWIEMASDIETLGYSLRRFVRGRLPGPDVERQATIDAVLAPYRDLRDQPIRTAVILEAHGRELTEHPSDEDRAELFLFGELFAFAALAARDFFGYDYCNRDDLRLVIQAFEDPRGGAFMEMRRRDGVQWSSVSRDHYRVQMPAHVCHGGKQIKPDCVLLEALLRSRSRDEWLGLYRGMVLFNQANTDAPDMSMDTELVLTYAAMEQILGLSGSDEKWLPAEFAKAWDPSREVPRSEWRAPPTDKPWTKDSLRACWAFDLRRCRGHLAHGNDESKLPSHWTVREHLLLTAFTVPSLVKQVLSGMGCYEPTDDDKRDIDALEPLLNLPDLFAEDDDERCLGEDYAWRRVLRREKDRQIHQLAERHWDRHHQGNGVDR